MNEVVKPITPKERGKRLRSIFLDWKKGKPYKGSGMTPFAKSLERTQRQVQKYFDGEVDTIASDVLDRLRMMGYSPEWVLDGTGKMKAAQKETMGFTTTLALSAELHTTRTELAIERARVNGLARKNDELDRRVSALETRLNKLVTIK